MPRFSYALLLALFLVTPRLHAQTVEGPLVRNLDYPSAKIKETTVHTLDLARRVRHFEATPNGSKWILVDKFGLWESVIVDGKRHPTEYHSIDVANARLSPNGKYTIWLGQEKKITADGFDSALTSVFRDLDSIGTFVSDFASAHFSPRGDQWVTLLPYANIKQSAPRNLVLLNGKVIAQNGDRPHQFTFLDSGWSYRTSGEAIESLITPNSSKVLHTRLKRPSGAYAPVDSIVWHYTPKLYSTAGVLEGRDHEVPGVAVRLMRTSYRAQDQRNALSYIVHRGQVHTPSRWISNITMDSTGNSLAYFSCDPKLNNVYTNRDERQGVVVWNGKVYDGPYVMLERLYMSPSGKQIAYSVSSDSGQIFLNKKLLGPAVQVVQCVWSPKETHIAYASVDGRGKVRVVAGGKISPEYERIGRIGWSKDGKFVEYLAVRYGKVLRVQQPI